MPPPSHAARRGRGLDHLVIAVGDLDAAGRRYEALGFQVGRRNRHPWGTENRLIQFPGAFLELIAIGEGAMLPEHRPGFFGFGAFIRDHLARFGDGIAMLVLESTDAAADKASFDAAGIGGFEPFHFERGGATPDGRDTTVSFSLAFAASPTMPDAGFFVCQQHRPENFWNEAFQAHPNGAHGLAGIVMVAAEPARHVGFLEAFAGVSPSCVGARNAAFVTPRGAIELMTRECCRDVLGFDPGFDGDSPRFAAMKIAMAPDALAGAAQLAGLPVAQHRRIALLPGEANGGVTLIAQRDGAKPF